MFLWSRGNIFSVCVQLHFKMSTCKDQIKIKWKAIVLKLNSAGLGFVFYTMPSTLLSAPSWSLWQMAETRHCVRVCVWHLRFLSLYLRVYWHDVKQKKKVIHHFNTIFLSKLQGVMTGEVNKKTFAATTQPAKQGKEEVKNRKHRWRNLGQEKSVTFQTFSPLPWNYAKTIFLPFHTDCSSNSTWYFVRIQVICLSQLFPTPTLPDDKGTEYLNGWAHGPRFCVIVKALNISTSCWCCLHFVALNFG